MCCNQTFCNPDADIENFEARNQPISSANQQNLNRNTFHPKYSDRNAAIQVQTVIQTTRSGSDEYEHLPTKLNPYGGNNGFDAHGALFSSQRTDEPLVDVLANSRRA